jgi:multidrug resistance efflux pump
MSDVETKSKREVAADSPAAVWTPVPTQRKTPRRRLRILPFVITLATIAVAVALGWAMWDAYMGAPWTRDGTVRAYVVTMAPEVEGRIVELPVADNQFVHKGDLLVVIDPRNFKIAVSLNEAAVQQAQVNAQNAEREAKRRMELTQLAVTKEEQQTFETSAVASQAQLQQAQANLEQARVNLERTEIRSPVNGWVTNLLAQLGDFASVGTNVISLVDADSFWIDGYFEETNLEPIQVGDPAEIKLMGYSQIVRGHVGSIARGINVANAQPNGQGLANVNPIFTWVRLAQRIPVRIHIDHVPEGVVLSAGMTATVQIDRRPGQPAKSVGGP